MVNTFWILIPYEKIGSSENSMDSGLQWCNESCKNGDIPDHVIFTDVEGFVNVTNTDGLWIKLQR